MPICYIPKNLYTKTNLSMPRRLQINQYTINRPDSYLW